MIPLNRADRGFVTTPGHPDSCDPRWGRDAGSNFIIARYIKYICFGEKCRETYREGWTRTGALLGDTLSPFILRLSSFASRERLNGMSRNQMGN